MALFIIVENGLIHVIDWKLQRVKEIKKSRANENCPQMVVKILTLIMECRESEVFIVQ